MEIQFYLRIFRTDDEFEANRVYVFHYIIRNDKTIKILILKNFQNGLITFLFPADEHDGVFVDQKTRKRFATQLM